MKRPTNNNESAGSLLVVLTVMAVLLVSVATAVEYTSTVGRHVQRSTTLQGAIAVGDGALETAFSYWRELCRVNTAVPIPNSWTALIPVPTAQQFPTIPNFTATTGTWTSSTTATISNFSVVAADAELNPLTASGDVPVPSIGTSGTPFEIDKTHAVYNWIASAYVTLPTVRGNVVAKVQRIFQKEQISPWNYAIFYVDPLEIHPGPDLDVDGPVSSNVEVYTGHYSLKFLDKMTFGTDWIVGFHPLDRYHTETPVSPRWVTGLPPTRDIAHQPFGLDATRIFNPRDTNPNNDSYHELVEPADTSYPDPLQGQRYYDQAGMVITVNSSNAISYARANGDGTVTAVTASSSGNDKKLYDMFNGAITTNQTLADAREGTNIRIATLDLSQIRKSDNTKWDYDGFNGIVYLRDSSYTSTTRRGFRIKNGAFIPPGGLTIASPNPVYIQGDYNTGTAPPSNTGTASDPDGTNAGVGSSGTNYTRQPCSVVADAVSILSNAFTDAKLGGTSLPPDTSTGWPGRLASNTTVNTAIVSGIVPTTTASYSGGAENFPRFLEDWNPPSGGQKTLTYYGSMVQLYNSTQSIGKWSSAVYDPPIRQWKFDTNFKFNCPPGTLMIYSYVKGRWSLVP